PLSFVISASAPLEEEVPIVITTKINGDISSSDTLIIVIGYPVFIFEDLSNNPATYWTITKSPSTSPQWDSTFKSFYSPPNSYTESKNGNYVNSATVTMSLTNPLNLSGFSTPRLRFRTRYNIENNWDYGQVQVSTNNGSSWIAIQGQYTQPGEGSFQPPGEPVYDGVRSNWATEEINLTNYLSSQFKIRFRLRTDNNTTRDGWYLDDIGIFIYTIPTEVLNETEPAFKFSLEQNYPNPFNPVTSIKYSIAEDGIVNLAIYNLLGEKVATVVNEEKSAGSYEVEFKADNLPSGIYFYKLQAGSFIETKKMIMLR
ncbi:MAG: T9SS type A sorting domain-containing protein, partial [Nitrososphaerales archaeon]